MPTFTTTLLSGGGNTTGIDVPAAIVEGFGRGRRVPVQVTLGGHTYRSSVTWYRGAYMIALSAANREAAHVSVGDTVEVTVEIDDAPRTVEMPSDLAVALADEPEAEARWSQLSFTAQGAHASSIEGAKTAETRARRLAKVLEALRG